MKYIANLKSSLLASLTLVGALFLPMGEARASEEPQLEEKQIVLCEEFCGFCSSHVDPYCSQSHCNSLDPCRPRAQALVDCLSGQGICRPAETEEETVCLQQQKDFNTCKELVPFCGDGLVTGGEECDDPEGNSQVCVNCQLIGS